MPEADPNQLSNLDLAREALVVVDKGRQVELATHPSLVVKQALLHNPHLDETARAILEGQRAELTASIEEIRELLGANVPVSKN